MRYIRTLSSWGKTGCDHCNCSIIRINLRRRGIQILDGAHVTPKCSFELLPEVFLYFCVLYDVVPFSARSQKRKKFSGPPRLGDSTVTVSASIGGVARERTWRA